MSRHDDLAAVHRAEQRLRAIMDVRVAELDALASRATGERRERLLTELQRVHQLRSELDRVRARAAELDGLTLH